MVLRGRLDPEQGQCHRQEAVAIRRSSRDRASSSSDPEGGAPMPTAGVRHRSGVTLFVAIAALLGASWLATSGVADAAFPGGAGKIVFTSGAKDSFDTSIWVMSADGTGRTQLTNFGPGAEGTPAWSPDGTTIAFVRRLDADGSFHIWTMDANG